jgi:dGTPase
MALTKTLGPLEAEIMDWADDVAYSVHDVEDLYRAGLIPLDRVWTDQGGERQSFLARVARGEGTGGGLERFDRKDLQDAFKRLISGLTAVGVRVSRPYDDTVEQRQTLQQLKSALIGNYVGAVGISENWRDGSGNLTIDDELRMQVLMLKQLAWVYVINGPPLTNRQAGQRQVIRRLFHVFRTMVRQRNMWSRLPNRYREMLMNMEQQSIDSAAGSMRVVVGLIASLTERQAVSLFNQLSGYEPMGQVDPPGLA